MSNFDKKKVLFVCSNEPIPTVTRKVNLLCNHSNFNVHLLYWHRLKSHINFPVDIPVPENQIHKVNLLEPNGNIFRRVTMNLFFLGHVVKHINQIKPDYIHIVNMDIWCEIALLTFFSRIKLVLDLIDTRSVFHEKRLFKIFINFAFHNTRLVFITSPLYLSKYLNKFNYAKDTPVVFAPNAPEYLDFENFRKKKHSGLIIGYIGAIRGIEGMKSLIQAVKKLRDEGKNITILFAGMGRDVNFVHQLCKQYSFVKFKGSFYYKEIGRFYAQVDVVYSLYDTNENKQIHMSCRYSDAVICELPIMVQKDTYQAHLVQKYQTGLVVDYKEPDTIYQALNELYSNDNLIKRIEKKTKSIRQENFFENYANDIIKAYQNI